MQQCCKYSQILWETIVPFTSPNMRSVYSLSFSLLITLLHIGCCVLPLLSLASVRVVNAAFLAEHQQIFNVMQWLLFVWLTGRLAAFYFWNKNFHSRAEKLSYLLGWLIAMSGLLINWWEPFKSEQQILAEQQFERFKSQRELRIRLAGTYNKEDLIADLGEIEGVRKKSIRPETGIVTLSYHKDKVSEQQIYEVLRLKGYIK